MHRKAPGTICLILASLAMSTGLFAQGTASLRGVVSDPQKASIAAASVTLTDRDNGLVHTTITQQTGEYQFTQLPPGLYSLKVEAPGFTVSQVDNLRLLVDTPSTADVHMDVATNTTAVNVSEEVEQLNTVDASVGNAFQERQVSSLPIQTRNAVQLLGFQPGVTQNGEVMGARRDQNNITLDGVDVNDNQNALSGLNGNNQGGLPSPSSNPTSTTSAPATGRSDASTTTPRIGTGAGSGDGGSWARAIKIRERRCMKRSLAVDLCRVLSEHRGMAGAAGRCSESTLQDAGTASPRSASASL